MKIFTGKVISKKMEKTATVAVERVVVHPVYKKRYKRVKKYHVHDDLGVEVGQKVRFITTRPYSKTKKWKIIEVVDGNLGKMPATTDSKSSKKIVPRKSVKFDKKSS